MYIFLDESGDLGFDFINKSPSTHFVITLLVCENKETFLSFKSAVKHTLKNKINYKQKKNCKNELKSTKTALAIKCYFFKNLLKKSFQDWQLHSIIVNKSKLLEQINALPMATKLYNILSYQILKFVDFNLAEQNIHLIVDLCKVPRERKIFNQYLLTNLKSHLPAEGRLDIKHELSHSNAGLQAVDLFCSGIARKFTQQDTTWYQCFKNKIVTEILYKP